MPAVSLNERAFCSRSASGTRASVSVMSAFCTVRRAILFSILVAVKPGLSECTTKPLTWLSSRSRAQITVRSANVALPIQRFWPLSTHSSPSRRAVVRSPAATSEPPVGSVSPNAPICSNRAIAGSQRSFCSSEPQLAMLPMASPECTPKKVAREASACAISSAIQPLSSDDGLVPAIPRSAYPLIS
jgi:hypothetical protein